MATHTGQQTKHIPFTELVTLHQQAVYGYLLRFTRDPHDAQDLFQETFLRAYRAYTGLQNTQDAHTQQDEQNEINYRAWLMRIAINLSKNYARDRQRRSRVLGGYCPRCFPAGHAGLGSA
jgi:RNA polymerase sigma-70 factor (ECF subfamily)